MSFFKNIWKVNSRHQKLPEEISLQVSKDSINEHIESDAENEKPTASFKLKYLGSTIIEKVSGENLSVEAVKSILNAAKSTKKKLQTVNVGVSLKGIEVTDNKGNCMFRISIYRISNCSTYSVHRQVFSFIAIDQHETMECHAFLCSKRKLAETVTLTVANAFSTAFEEWKLHPETKAFQESLASEAICMESHVEEPQIIEYEAHHQDTDNLLGEEKLIDFGDEVEECRNVKDLIPRSPSEVVPNNTWVSFDDHPTEQSIGQTTMFR